MTPKEKAEELVDRYMDTIISFLNDNMKYKNAKKCALIAVDEIDYQLRTNIPNGNHTKRYWLEVRQEIEKL